jgi:hypothetical protein
MVNVNVFVLATPQSVALTVVDAASALDPNVTVLSLGVSLVIESTVESPIFQVTISATGVPGALPTVAVAPTKSGVVCGALVPLGAVSVRSLTTGQTLTVAVVVAVIAPSLALIVVLPMFVTLDAAVTSPLFCPTDAVPGSDEVQTDLLVTTWVLPSLNVPVAVI